jgi:hypothetical protein
MSTELKRLNRLGAVSLVASGVLFLARAVLDLVTGVPPSNGLDILLWTASYKTVLSFANELLFFAALFLVPAMIALYQSLVAGRRALAAAGCGIIMVTIPVLAVLDIVHGRLVYPVFGISAHTPEVAEFIVAVFYGGLHAVGIIIGIATVILSLSMRRGAYGQAIVFLGLVTGILDIVGAYPFIIGPILTFVCQVIFTAWFIAVGWKLWKMNSSPSNQQK